MINLAPVAQLDRAPGFYPGCWGFESSRVHQFGRRGLLRRAWTRACFPPSVQSTGGDVSPVYRGNCRKTPVWALSR